MTPQHATDPAPLAGPRCEVCGTDDDVVLCWLRGEDADLCVEHARELCGGDEAEDDSEDDDLAYCDTERPADNDAAAEE